MLLPRAASLAPLGVFSTPSGGLGPRAPSCFLFSVFQNARPPATPRRLGPPLTQRSKTLGPIDIYIDIDRTSNYWSNIFNKNNISRGPLKPEHNHNAVRIHFVGWAYP